MHVFVNESCKQFMITKEIEGRKILSLLVSYPRPVSMRGANEGIWTTMMVI